MAVIIPVASKFDDKGIKQAKSAFSGLAGTLKGVVGSLGVITSLAGLASALQEATQQASADNKAQILLAQQLRNTTDATDAQIAAVETSISQMSIMAAVSDDQLRPAMASLVRATGDVGQAQKLLSLSLDVSAATGKDLQAVSLAIGKAVTGQTSQLFRMIPALKGSDDWMAKLTENTKGMAAAAGNADPFMRLQIIFDELQESIGMALLPSLQTFANWLSSPDTQNALKFMIDGFNGWVAAMKNTVDGANAVGQTLANVLNINPNVAGQAWNGFFNGLGRSIQTLIGGPFGRLIFTFLNLLGGGNKMEPVDFTPVTFTPTDFEGVDYSSPDAPGPKKKTKEELAAEKAAKALAELKKFQSGIKDAFDFTELTRISADLGAFEQSVVDNFDSLYEKLKDAPKGTDLTALKTFLNAQKALLVENAKQRDAIIAKRSLAEALINDVKSALTGTGNLASLLDTQSKQITTSVTKIVNGFSVTTKQTVDEVIGAKGVVGRLKEVVAKTKAFANQLKDLKAAGLSPDLFKQIVDAGPDVGGQLATEILAGGKDSVTALNDTFKELETVSATVAEQTAVVMYNNGVDVAGGLVAGLLSQEQALVDAAKTLADAFNLAYQSQVTALVPEAPKVTPKKGSTIISNTANVTIRTSNDTKSDAQKIIAKVNKFYQSNTGAKVAAGKFVF